MPKAPTPPKKCPLCGASMKGRPARHRCVPDVVKGATLDWPEDRASRHDCVKDAERKAGWDPSP